MTLAAIACAGTCAAVLFGVHGRAAQLFGRSVYRGNGRRRSLALTFDDGPSHASPALLDLLAAEHIRATFFLCGKNAQRHPEIVRRIRDSGHEIGNHTFSHARLCPRLGFKLNLRSPAAIYRELAATQQTLHHIAATTPRLFRAPYGLRWFGLAAAQRKLGLLGVLWTVMPHDWEWTAPRIVRHVLDLITPGGILCLHDGRDIRPHVDLSEMLAALGQLIPALRGAGYRFETVSALLRPDAAA